MRNGLCVEDVDLVMLFGDADSAARAEESPGRDLLHRCVALAKQQVLGGNADVGELNLAMTAG